VFVPEFNNNIAVSYCDVHLSSVLSYKVLYSWGNNEDVGRKVIVISSCVLEDIDSVTKIALLDAADKCVSVDFVLLEKVSGSRSSLLESIDNFNRNICDLENCSFRNHLLASRSKSSKFNTHVSMVKAKPSYTVRGKKVSQKKDNGLGDLSVTVAQAMLDAGANNVGRIPRPACMSDHLNKRGGNVKLQSILMPSSKFDHAEKGDALYAMELALSLEKLTNEKLLHVHAVEAIKKISEYVAQLRRIGKGHDANTCTNAHLILRTPIKELVSSYQKHVSEFTAKLVATLKYATSTEQTYSVTVNKGDDVGNHIEQKPCRKDKRSVSVKQRIK
nr:ferritin-4, chloroplastic-like [Tanacetum cinerariifolium]